MNILITEAYPEIKPELLSYANHHTFYHAGDDFKNEEIEAVIIRSKTKIDTDFLDLYPNLRFVFRVGVGLDKVDMNACKKKNIVVENTPQANADSVADLVVGAMIMGLRNTYKDFSGINERFSYMGRELSSCSIGIVGFGNIGKKVHKRLRAFGVETFFIYDPFLEKKEIEAKKHCEKIEDKETVFSRSDILTFHIPLLPSTKNFLGKKDFELLQKDAVIINTARGGIIDEEALVDFLKEHKEAFYFADVWEEEPNAPKEAFLQLKNIKLTPHIGAMTREAEKKMHFFPDLKN